MPLFSTYKEIGFAEQRAVYAASTISLWVQRAQLLRKYELIGVEEANLLASSPTTERWRHPNGKRLVSMKSSP